jgi:SAM-dependent methyltransferase
VSSAGIPVSAEEYYEAFERALSGLTQARGEYRRHFGISERPQPEGYCWFKGVVSPERHPDYAEWACDAATELEERFLSELPRLAPRSVLDVGCGNGALLQKLAGRLPQADLVGINLQPAQVRVARQLLAATRATVVEGDFLRHDFSRRFELICLVESAFHIADKNELCRKLAQLLEPGGEIWILDIVIAERAANAFATLGRDQSVFSYIPLEEWRALFEPQRIQELEIVDFSRGVSEFLKVSDIEALRDQYFAPRIAQSLQGTSPASAPVEPGRSLELMTQIATEYRRLSRLLRGGMLQYVMMRWRKVG